MTRFMTQNAFCCVSLYSSCVSDSKSDDDMACSFNVLLPTYNDVNNGHFEYMRVPDYNAALHPILLGTAEPSEGIMHISIMMHYIILYTASRLLVHIVILV